MPDDLKNFLETTALKDRLDALKATTPSQRQMLAGNFQTTPPPPSPSSRRLVYSIPQAARALGVSERTLWRLIAAEKIKTIKISVGRTGIATAELERIAA